MDVMYFSWLDDTNPAKIDGAVELPQFKLKDSVLNDCSAAYLAGRWRYFLSHMPGCMHCKQFHVPGDPGLCIAANSCQDRQCVWVYCRQLHVPGDSVRAAARLRLLPDPDVHPQCAHCHPILGVFLDQCRLQSCPGVTGSTHSTHTHHPEHVHPFQSAQGILYQR
jgi:hypothetical protein